MTLTGKKILKSAIGIYSVLLLSGNFVNVISSSDMCELTKKKELERNIQVLNGTFEEYRKISYRCEKRLSEIEKEGEDIKNFPFLNEGQREHRFERYLNNINVNPCYESANLARKIDYFFYKYPEFQNYSDEDNIGTMFQRWKGIREVFTF